MEHYQELKSELLEISTVLEKFPESLRQSVYELLVSEYMGKKSTSSTAKVVSEENPVVPDTKSKPKNRAEKSVSATPKRRSPGSAPKIDGALNLRPSGIKPFKDFYAEKSPTNNVAEFITIALYYLKHSLSIASPTHDQVFTCFKEVGKKVPEAFAQAFSDTKNKQGYINISDDGIPLINLRGENLVEHDLPRLAAKKGGK